MGAQIKLGTKVARLKRSIRGRIAPDEDGLEFVSLAISKDDRRGLSLERELLAVIYILIIVALEYD